MALNCLGRATKVEELFSVGKYCYSETAQDFLYQARSKIPGAKRGKKVLNLEAFVRHYAISSFK